MDEITNKTKATSNDDFLYKLKCGIFLVSVAGVSTLIGFSKTLSASKREEQKLLEKSIENSDILLKQGTKLAVKALGWGSLYAILGTSVFCYGIWTFSGAKNIKDFRQRMGSILPKITSDQPPKSRTEFEGLNDLLAYLSDWGKK